MQINKETAELYSSTVKDIEAATKKLLTEAKDIDHAKPREDMLHRLLINACASHKMIANLCDEMVKEVRENGKAEPEKAYEGMLSTLQTVHEISTTTFVAVAAVSTWGNPGK